MNIRGDRDRVDVEVSQYRLVTGITGNITDTWYYDAFISYSASSGKDTRTGVGEAQLINSLDAVVNADGSVSCADTSDGCVPTNFFRPGLWQAGGGYLTPASYDYLMLDRVMETDVSQFIVSGFVGGEFLTLPWNNETVNGVVGIEFRKDEIKSNPNDVAAGVDGSQLWGYFSDLGADGSRNLKEAFAEFDFPLVRGMTAVEELTFTASGRISDESYYDPATTYSLKGVYRPVEWVTLRGTQGTSYRAPNLRERFINGTTGFNTVTDPCVVPDDARVQDPSDPSSSTNI